MRVQTSLLVLVILMVPYVTFAFRQSKNEDQALDTSGYKRKFPSMALSNWKDNIITWSGPRDNPNQDAPIRSAGITSFRIASNWATSAISGDSFALRYSDGTNTFNLTNPFFFDGDVQLMGGSGEFRTNIETYSSSISSTNENSKLPFQMKRSYYLPPDESFYIIEYSFVHNTQEHSKSDDVSPKDKDESKTHNEQGQTYEIDLLDFIITDAQSSNQDVKAIFDTKTNLFTTDLTQAGQYYFVSGYIGTDESRNNSVSQFSVGSATGASSPVQQFADQGFLNGQTTLQATQVSFGSVISFKLSPSSQNSFYFFRALAPNQNSALSVANRVSSQPAIYWIKSTASSYTSFLQQGKQPTTLNPDARKLYENSVLMMKNSQNPTVGTFVASFHPAYGFKVWSRDGCFSALIMANAGYLRESELYLRWMSKAQLRPDGGFHTCYDWFTGLPVGFVEPQNDNLGAYLMGVYQQYAFSKNIQFLVDVYPRVNSVENYFLNNINDTTHNFVPADYSIWEESSTPLDGTPLPPSYFTFTQGMGVGGCVAAYKMEQILGNGQRALEIRNLGGRISNAINKELWIQTDGQDTGYYARSMQIKDSSLDTRVDASTMSVLFTGTAISPSRALSHLRAVTANLTIQKSGIGRYWGDIFFYKSKWNPGGQEVGAATPPWGVTTMFTAWGELSLSGVTPGGNPSVNRRLQWMVDHAAFGGMPVGEAVDGVTGTFVMSSCPDLYEYAGVYIWTVLMNEGKANIPDPTKW